MDAQYVATIGQGKTTHALREGWTYDAPRIAECGRETTGVQSMHSGTPLEITCKACIRVLSKRETTQAAQDAPVSASEDACVGFVECPCRKCRDTRVKVTEEHSQHSEHTAYCLTCKGNRELANDVRFAAPARVRVSGPCEWTRTDSEGQKHVCEGGIGFGRADAVHMVKGKRLCAYHSPKDTTAENLAQFGYEDARPAAVWVMNTSGYWIEYAVIPNGDPHRVSHFLRLAKAIPAYKTTAHVRYIGDPTPTPVKDAPMASQDAPVCMHGNDSDCAQCMEMDAAEQAEGPSEPAQDMRACESCGAQRPISGECPNCGDTLPASEPKSGKWDAVLAVKSPTGIYSLPSVDNYPNERAYQSATENADDMCREQGFTFYGPEWFNAFKSSYAYSLEIQAEEENNTRYVGVRQGPVGFSAPEHIHVAGCRDIAREMKRWGQKETDTFSYHAGITYADLTFDNWGDIASDNYADPYNEREAWLDMLSWMNDDLSGSKIMPCAQKMELGDTPFGPIVRDGAYYTIAESPVLWHVYANGQWFPVEWSGAGQPVSPKVQGTDTYVSGIEYAHTVPLTGVGTCPLCTPEAEETHTQTCLTCGESKIVPGDWDVSVVYCADCTEAGKHMDTRTSEDMDDTMTAPLTMEAQLSVVVDGVTIDLGWHEFTLSAGQTEHDIPAMYGEKNGTWSRPGAPDWASVITVTATGACWH